MHLHLLSVFRNASSLGFRLQIVVHFLPPSLSSFFSFLSGILRSIYRPGSIRRDGEPACFLRDRGNHRHDRAVNSLWRCSLLLFEIIWSDAASLFLFAVSPTSFDSNTRFRNRFFLSFCDTLVPIPRCFLPLFHSLQRSRSRIHVERSSLFSSLFHSP